jgi:hypothetical protein
MRTKAAALISAVAFSTGIGVALRASTQTTTPDDFALYLETDCPADAIDTKVGEFRRRVGLNELVTAAVPLDAATRAGLFRLVSDARLFEYPAKYNPPWTGGFSVPYPHYTIRVVSNGREHTIQWGAIRVPNEDARRPSDFIGAVYRLYRGLPPVQALPAALPCL